MTQSPFDIYNCSKTFETDEATKEETEKGIQRVREREVLPTFTVPSQLPTYGKGFENMPGVHSRQVSEVIH